MYKNINCKSQVKLYRSFIKYGVDNHKFEVITECGVGELNRLERYYQELYNSIDKRVGLNCSLVNTNEKKQVHLKETREKIGNAHRGNTIPKHMKEAASKRFKGIPKTESHRNNISKGSLGKKLSDSQKIKIGDFHRGKKISKREIYAMIDANSKLILDTATGIYYKNTKYASEALNIKRGHLCNMLAGSRTNKTSLKRV